MSFDPIADVEKLWQDVSTKLPRFGPPTMRDISLLRYLVIHHTASSSDATPADIARDGFQRLRCDGISYHFLVYHTGDIFLVRNANERGCCVELKNTPSLCISNVGNFDTDTPTDAMIQALANLSAWALIRYPTITDVYRHNFFMDTDCPGKNFTWYAFATALRANMRGNAPFLAWEYRRNFNIEGGGL